MLQNYGGRNNELSDQKGQDLKGARQIGNPLKEILPWVKRTISNVNGRQKIFIKLSFILVFYI